MYSSYKNQLQLRCHKLGCSADNQEKSSFGKPAREALGIFICTTHPKLCSPVYKQPLLLSSKSQFQVPAYSMAYRPFTLSIPNTYFVISPLSVQAGSFIGNKGQNARGPLGHIDSASQLSYIPFPFIPLSTSLTLNIVGDPSLVSLPSTSSVLQYFIYTVSQNHFSKIQI